MKILFSNLGYARGLNGELRRYIRHASRIFYLQQSIQQSVLAQFRSIISQDRPELCCMVELDSGSLQSGYYNQISALLDHEYIFQDTANKYGETSWLNWLPLHGGKSNALLARTDFAFKRLYFRNGSKRLIYEVLLPDIGILLFTHFSLRRKTRLLQFLEMRELIKAYNKPVIIMADFNIFSGFDELRPLLTGTDLVVLNDPKIPTFTFHRRQLTLDLCICSSVLVDKIQLQVIPQPYSDHAALLINIQ